MTIAEMVAALSNRTPPEFVRMKEAQGSKIEYIPWYLATALADQRVGGRWSYIIGRTWVEDIQRGAKGSYTPTPLIHVIVSVTLHGDDGTVTREAIGVDDDPTGQRGTPYERAEGAGIRRALAKFGLGRELYDKGRPQAPQAATNGQSNASRQAPPPPAKANGTTNGKPPPDEFHATPLIDAMREPGELAGDDGIMARIQRGHHDNVFAKTAGWTLALVKASERSSDAADIGLVDDAYRKVKKVLAPEQKANVDAALTAARALHLPAEVPARGTV